jgi:hypothetical protein
VLLVAAGGFAPPCYMCLGNQVRQGFLQHSVCILDFVRSVQPCCWLDSLHKLADSAHEVFFDCLRLPGQVWKHVLKLFRVVHCGRGACGQSVSAAVVLLTWNTIGIGRSRAGVLLQQATPVGFVRAVCLAGQSCSID